MDTDIHILKTKGGVVEFLHSYMDFETESDDQMVVYSLVLIARQRENPSVTYNSEIVFSEIVTDSDNIERKVEKLWTLGENYHAPDHDTNPKFRLYCSVNNRDVQSAVFDFQQEMNHINEEIYNGNHQMLEKNARLDSLWNHTLQKDTSRHSRDFLIDVDETDEDVLSYLVEQFEDVTTVYDIIESPNGYHLITESFGFPQYDFYDEYDVEVKTDDLVFLTMI